MSKLKIVCVYGGVSKLRQYNALNSGVHVVVATPGRLLDLMSDGSCDLSAVTYLVLDEADRMLDMGFEQDIRKILESLPSQNKRQTCMFSATWPSAIRKIASQFLNAPIRVIIGSASEGILAANEKVEQIVEVIEDRARGKRLVALLQQYHSSRTNRVLVFVLYKKEAVQVELDLLKWGWNAVSIHANKSQRDRTAALQSFKDGSIPIMVATDVAARGLDIPQVEYVINYSFPLTVEDYVHRIGRTGRAGAKGISHTFFQMHDKHLAGSLVNVLKETSQTIPQCMLQFDMAIKKKEPKLGKIIMDEPKTGHITFDSDDD